VSEPVRVMVLGTGQMGGGIARLVLARPGLKLVAVVARRPERRGVELARAIGLGEETGIAIHTDLEAAIRESRPQIAIQATCSTVADALPEITALLRHGVDVISIAEEMAWPATASPDRARDLRQLALAHGASVLGTGINPGFVLDLLVIALSGVCADIRSITATRVNDLSPYGPTVLASQGVGLSPQAFYQGLESGTVVGHFGFDESIHMIAATLGWEIERVEQRRVPIVSAVARQTPFVSIRPGDVAGCHHSAVAFRDGEPAIILDHPQQVLPGAEGVKTGDRIDIAGTPSISLAGSPEIPGGQGTVNLAVNMIPLVLNAAPGLYAMADLPVPRATLGDARQFLRPAGPETPGPPMDTTLP